MLRFEFSNRSIPYYHKHFESIQEGKEGIEFFEGLTMKRTHTGIQ